MKISKTALAVAMGLGGSGIVMASAAEAQRAPRSQQQSGQQQQQAQQPAESGKSQLDITPEEAAALIPLQTAIQAKDWAAAQAALPAAQAAAQSDDAKYFVGRTAYVIASQTGNTELERQAIDTLVALPKTPPNELNAFLNRQAELAFNANDFAKAERAYNRLLQLNPGDQRVLNNLSIVRARLGDNSGAVDAIRRTIEAAEAAGQRAEESAYRRLLGAALEANQRDLATRTATQLVSAYPTPENWRTALEILRRNLRPEAATDLDIYRLQRAADALAGEQDYVLFAEQLNRGGFPAEAKAVLDEGAARNQISLSSGPAQALASSAAQRISEDRASLPGQQQQARAAAEGRLARTVGDALYGYGRYGDAAEMYRLALQKGGEDPNMLNTRLGAALAMAGQRAEAEAAFRAVSGARQPLAEYWLLWLNSSRS